jgi:hypothetical protein
MEELEMERTFKCPKNHKFKSDKENPQCPECSEPGTPFQWNRIGSDAFKDNKSDDSNILKKTLGLFK